MSKPKKETNIEIPEHLLKKLLTSSELRMLKNRYKIINLLKTGLSVRSIAKEVKVGTDTVVRVARMFEKSGLNKHVGKEETKFKSNTPWIFGKSEN